jgi:hypothetical protein
MNECPCCSQSLLRCISKNKVYWFCPDCRQEMPNLEAVIKNQRKKENIAKLNRMYGSEELSLKKPSKH